MNSGGRWSIVFGLAAAGSWLGSAAGCSDPGVAQECTPPAATGRIKPVDLFVDDDSHWIVKDPSGVCQSSSKWKGTRMFGAGSEMGGIMATYCAYAWMGDGAPDFAPLMGLARARDRRGLMPQTPATVESWAHDTFLQGIALPTQAPGADKRVRVIVADTERFGAVTGGMVGNNLHGALMAALVREVACPATGPCSVQVQRELALPRRRNPTTHLEEQMDNRGDFGRLSDLVVAVDHSLQRWRADVAGGGPFPPMLALSLSLAFDKGPKPLPADEAFSADDVVLDALKAFSCHGGAIFAAAGNHGGQGTSGLMYPAAWQNLPEPDATTCAALFNSKSYDFYGAFSDIYHSVKGQPLLHRPYAPTDKEPTTAFLLHAIGAFDRGGIPIEKTREEACPRFGALGLGWSVSGALNPLLTGTSVPTAVVSGFFAAAMAQSTYIDAQQSISHPYLAAHPQTMLNALAAVSPKRAFGAEGPCEGQWTCPDIPWFGGTSSATTLPQNDDLNFPWADYSGTAPSLPGLAQQTACTQLPICEHKAGSAVAAVFPQPNSIPCTRACFVNLTDHTFLIDPMQNITEVRLVIDAGAAGRQIFNITAANTALPTLNANQPYTVFLGTGLSVPSGARLSVSALVISTNAVVSDQVLLAQ